MTRARDVADTQDNLGGAVAPFVAGKNKIINGDFGIWQRGTSFSTSAAYTADRYVLSHGVSSGVSVTQQTFTPGTAPVSGYEGKFFMNIAGTITNTATGFLTVAQRIEDVRTFAGQTVTYSFWARGSTSGTISTGLNQNFGTGGSPSTNIWVGNSQHSITTSWQRFSATFAVPSIAGKTLGTNNDSVLSLFFTKNIGTDYQSDYGPANYTGTLSIWGVQIETGSVATPFTTASGSIGGELALCQRYYYRTPLNSGSSSYFIAGAYSTTAAVGVMSLPVSLRVPPTSIDTNSLRLFEFATGSGLTAATFTVSATQSTGNTVEVTATYGSSAYTAGRTYLVSANGGTGFIGFGAEL